MDRISEAVAEVRLSEKPVPLKAQAKLSAAALLAIPVSALRGLRDGSLSADVTLLGLELADLSGHLGVPEGLRGLLTGEAHLSERSMRRAGRWSLLCTRCPWRPLGPLRSCRGRGLVTGWSLRRSFDWGTRAPQLKALLRAPIERLTDQARLRAVQATASLTVPPSDLKQGKGLGWRGVIVEAQLQLAEP